MRKVLAITGARSEYDLLTPVYSLLALDKRFEFEVLITGPHLSEKFGLTAKYIYEDGYKVAGEIYNLVDSDKKIGRVISTGNLITPLAHFFNQVKPDIVLVAGDREEAIAVTMVAAFMDIPVAHFFGGDIAKDGNIDNSIRYASSKFAHIHFTTLEEHKNNLLQLGEDEWRIFVVGNPALDKFINTPIVDRAAIGNALGASIENEKYLVLIQHSIITEVEKQDQHIRETLDAIVRSGLKCFINYPNSDPGNAAICKAYDEYAFKYPQLKVFRNLNRELYINLLRNASCLVGNSSSGLLEAPSIGLPAINIGSRQRGRLHGENVIFVDNDANEIYNAITFALNDADFRAKVLTCKNPYGNGNSAGKVVEILASIEFTDKLIHKNITY